MAESRDRIIDAVYEAYDPSLDGRQRVISGKHGCHSLQPKLIPDALSVRRSVVRLGLAIRSLKTALFPPWSAVAPGRCAVQPRDPILDVSGDLAPNRYRVTAVELDGRLRVPVTKGFFRFMSTRTTSYRFCLLVQGTTQIRLASGQYA